MAVVRRTERGLDQHPVRHVADAAADPVAECGKEARVIAEALFGVDEHTGVEVRLALRERLKHACEHVHAYARHEPRDGGTNRPRRIGECPWQENIPAPAMPPTTIAVSCMRLIFCPLSTIAFLALSGTSF